MEPKITFLLTTNGRDSFTERFLLYIEKINFQCKIIIGDGKPDPVLSIKLKNKSIFKNIDYDYILFEDTSYYDYYHKSKLMCERVTTPYSMLIDNDDFILPNGIIDNLNFLEKNLDYQSSRGHIGGFSLKRNKLYGDIDKLNKSYFDNYLPINYLPTSKYDDLLFHVKYNIPCFYNIFRTETLLEILKKIEEINFTDLNLHELYITMKSVVIGKNNYLFNSMHYIRQYGSSQQGDRKIDWSLHLLNSNYSTDYNNALKDVYNDLNINGLAFSDFKFNISKLYSVHLRERLISYYNQKIEYSSSNILSKIFNKIIYLFKNLKIVVNLIIYNTLGFIQNIFVKKVKLLEKNNPEIKSSCFQDLNNLFIFLKKV